MLRREGIPRFGGLIDPGLGLLAGGAVISAVFGDHPWQSSVFAAALIGAVAVSYLFLEVVAGRLQGSASDRTFAWFEYMVGFSAAVFAIFSLCSWLLAGASGRNEYPFGHSTYVAGAAVLALPVLGGFAWTRRPGRILWILALMADGAVLISTESRGGVIGAVVIVMLVALSSWRRSHHRVRNGWLLSLAAVTTVALLVASNPRLRDFVTHREWGALASESNRQRSAMLTAGVELGLERPLLGHGPGTVPYEYPRVRANLAGGVDNVLQLHSTPVHVWVEQGAIGLLGGLMVMAGFLRRALGALAVDGDRDLRRRSVTALLAFAGYGVMALTDFQLDVPFIGVGVAALLILGTGSEPRGAEKRLRMAGIRWAMFAVLASIVGWSITATFSDAKARARLDHGLTALESGDSDAYLVDIADAIEHAPWDVFYRNQLAMFWLREASLFDGADEQNAARRVAVDALEGSLVVDQAQEFPHFNLGWLQFQENPVQAIDHFYAAARLVPDKGGVYFGLGVSYREGGDLESAARAFALEWLNDPIAMTTPVWENPDFTSLRPMIVEALAQHVVALQSNPIVSSDDQETARYVLELARWWTGADPGEERLVATTTGERGKFFRALAFEGIETSVAESRWEHLLKIWRSSNAPAELERRAAAVGLQPAEVSVFQRWLVAVPPGPDPFRAPLVGDPALFPVLRNTRPGYGVLMRNQDGLILTDVYVRQINRIARDFIPFLFPQKGWLDSRANLDRLETIGTDREG